MNFWLKYGNVNIDQILAQCEAEGSQPPDFLRDIPTPEISLLLYWQGFMDLTKDRTVHMGGEGYIPWGVIRNYCNQLGLSEEQTDDMHYFLGAMDNVYLRYVHKK